MKRYLALILALCLVVLCGCSGNSPEEPSTEAPTEEVTEAPTEEVTEVPTEEATEEPTEESTEPPVLYYHPLTGVPLEQEHTTRIISLSIGNTYDAMPTLGLSQVDMLFEVYINGLTTRFLALYGDPSGVPAIGSMRSHRYPFTDLALSYDTIAFHAGGSGVVMSATNRSGIPHINLDTETQTAYSFRDKPRNATGIAFMHCLMAKGDGLYAEAERRGISIVMDKEKVYPMNFTEEAALTEGQPAGNITLTFRLSNSHKDSIFTYDAESGLYHFRQFNQDMVDANNDQPVAFRNVFILLANVWTDADGYHISEILGSGEGWFACDGYMIPITWHRETDTDPFSFTLEDGTPLVQGMGSSYIAIAPTQSKVVAE